MKFFAVLTTTMLRDAKFLNITDFSTSAHTSEIPENLPRIITTFDFAICKSHVHNHTKGVEQ